ncbi:MAG: RNA polymerase sigma factor [Candidatus Brocadiia bacterium]|jgi:RNA polymerase sigma-70 factor (ECF subfamily)
MDSLPLTHEKRARIESAYADLRDRLLILAAALTADWAAAEDVVHDAFATIVREHWRLQNGFNLEGFLTVCVRNRAMNVLRSETLRKRAQPHSGFLIDPKASDPGARTVAQEERAMLLDAVRKLSPENREILSLRIWGGLSFEEISQLQEIAKSSAHDRYRQALSEVRIALQEVQGGRNERLEP